MKKLRIIKLSAIAGLIIVFGLIGMRQVSAQTVWLDQLDLSAATQGWGVPMKNKSIDGKTLTIAGKTFERGFATHSVSSLLILLDGKATAFTAQVGVDDEVTGQDPAVEFQLVGDGKQLWSSGVMRLSLIHI